MTITAKEAAWHLDGNEYRKEGSRELFADMRAAGLVAVFGASDDLIKLRGAVNDEIGAYDGGEFCVTPSGLPKNECENDDCPYFHKSLDGAETIKALWCDEDGISWTYRTDIPHDTFNIMEDGEVYCRGIVFALRDTAR